MKDSCSINDVNCNTTIKGDIDLEKYWCAAYKTDVTTLGWYEKESKPSFELIKKTNINKNARILNIGAGATTLIDTLIADGYSNLIVNDISSCAMGNIKARIGEDNSSKVKFITDDIIKPNFLDKIEKVDLWNDRAVLHFFIKQNDLEAYFNLLHSKVKRNGFVILAEFNLEGPTKCSGLNVKRYDSDMLQKALGEDYILLEKFDYDYVMPNKEIRKYIYTLFQRK